MDNSLNKGINDLQGISNKDFDYRALFDQNLAGIYRTTVKGTIINCNDAFARMLKYSSCEELHNTNAFNLYFSQVDRNTFVTKLKERNSLQNYESILKCKDGSQLCVIENLFLKTDPDTGEDFIDGIMIDISERKKTELQLKETNLKYQAIIDNPMNAFVLSNINGDLLDANTSACNLFGYTKEEIIKLNRIDILEVHDKKFIDALTIREKTGIAGAEINGIKKGGERFPIAFISSVFKNAANEERVSSLITDISERKKTEEQILLSEKRFKSLVQNGSDLLGILDTEGNYLYVSPTSKSILGYDPEDLVLKNAFTFIHEEDQQKTKEALEGIATEKIVKIPLFRFKNASGEWRWIETTITNQLDNPAIAGLVVNSKDVTEKKELEEKVTIEKIIRQKEITEAVIAAQESERSEIGRELHDNVNQLLTAAKLYTDMAKTDDENKAAFLNSASTYTITAIEEIRKLSKTLITPMIKDMGLKDAIKRLMDDIMVIHPIKISFSWNDIDEADLNEKYKLNVFRIIQEQINNVIKHAKASNIEITFEEKNRHLIILICDDGIGFDFTKRKKGIGISNIISRAALYKGDVCIDTEHGKGCHVRIDFVKSNLIMN